MAQEVPPAAAVEALEPQKGQDVADVATADLISLPSPVTTVATNVFDTLEESRVEQAMGELTLTQDQLKQVETVPTEAAAPNLDGLLKLSLQQSSGRLPVTPPSTPEPFLVHSPEKAYPRVSPMALASSEQEKKDDLDVIAEAEEAVAEEMTESIEATSEQMTSTLSESLADMNLVSENAPFAEEIAHEIQPDEVALNSTPVGESAPGPEFENAGDANVEVETPLQVLKESDSVAVAVEEVRTSEQPPADSAEAPRRNKRKEISETKQQPTSSAAPVHAAKPRVAASAIPTKQEVAKVLSDTNSQPRRAKRKGDTSDVTPPPAPAAAATKEAAPKRLIIRTRSGTALHRTDATAAKPEANDRHATVAHAKKDSIMNPTASSKARATETENRKITPKSSAVKKAPVRKPVGHKVQTKQEIVPTADQEKNSAAPPAPFAISGALAAEEDAHRNVKRRLNATDAQAASKRLYEDAKEAKLRKDARRAELQEIYTFAPQVNTSRRRSVPQVEAEVGEKDRFSRLHAQAKELSDRKRELQQQHERDGCTFAPAISARAKRLPQTTTGPRYENLYKHAQTLKQKREEKLLEKAKTTEEECPFKPKITAAKSPVKTRPLYDSEREKQKRLALEQKKIEAEMSECTFKPKVSAKRLKSKTDDTVDDTSTTDAPVDANPYNRLYQASIQRTERLQKLRHERDEEEKAQAPFQPKITNLRSRASKERAKTKQPFHKRLYNKDHLQKVDAARQQRKLEGEQFTFKPEINEPPEDIKAKVKERADSPGKSIYERLYDEKNKVKEKIEIGEELRLQKEMAECTFRPQIEIESNGEPTPPVWERLLSYDKAQVIEEREKIKEQMEMQECTFKPEVKSPEGFALRRNSSCNVFDRLNGSGSNSPASPLRASFVTRRPSSSPGRQSPDTRSASIGRIIKQTKFNLPTERKIVRTHSVSQPSSVSKPILKRAKSFSGPKSASSSSTVLDNYDSWSATLQAKLKDLSER